MMAEPFISKAFKLKCFPTAAAGDQISLPPALLQTLQDDFTHGDEGPLFVRLQCITPQEGHPEFVCGRVHGFTAPNDTWVVSLAF